MPTMRLREMDEEQKIQRINIYLTYDGGERERNLCLIYDERE